STDRRRFLSGISLLLSRRGRGRARRSAGECEPGQATATGAGRPGRIQSGAPALLVYGQGVRRRRPRVWSLPAQSRSTDVRGPAEARRPEGPVVRGAVAPGQG